MAEPFLAEIRMLPYTFAPRGWAWCNGQLLPIAQYSALFSLLGTTYGGDGRTTFGLPDLQGRAPMAPGQGPGLTPRSLGEIDGTETVPLTGQQISMHAHGLQASADGGASNNPVGGLFAKPAGRGAVLYNATPNPAAPMNPQTIAVAGQGQPHNNLMPYLTLNFCIAMQGIFPSRG